MTSERSCDNEDWGYDAENSALITGKKIHFKTHSNSKQLFFNCNNISQYCCNYQMNADLNPFRTAVHVIKW